MSFRDLNVVQTASAGFPLSQKRAEPNNGTALQLLMSAVLSVQVELGTPLENTINLGRIGEFKPAELLGASFAACGPPKRSRGAMETEKLHHHQAQPFARQQSSAWVGYRECHCQH